MIYDSYLKHKWDNKNVRDYAIKEAVTAAREDERAKALAEKKVMAAEMKKAGISISSIESFTKLTIEEIEKL